MARTYRDRTAVLTQDDGARWTFSTVEHVPEPTQYVLEDVTGWYGGSGVRREVTDRYGHGNFMGPGFREGRNMTLKGGIICASSDERDWQERNISGVLWNGLEGTLWYDDGETQLSTRVALDGAPQVAQSGTRALVVQIPLISESPFLHSDWREFTMDPPGLGVGFEFPPFSGTQTPFGENTVADPNGRDPEIIAQREERNPTWNWSAAGYWWKRDDIEGSNYFGLELSSDDRYETIELEGGKRYQLSFEAFVDAGTADCRYAIRYTLEDGSTEYVGDGTEEGGDSESHTTIEGGSWHTVTRWWDAPEDAVSASFDLQMNMVPEEADEIRFRSPSIRVSEPVITFGTEKVREQNLVWNEGNADSYPLFTVYADAPGGFTIGLVDRRITYPWATFMDVPVTVDMEGALIIGGIDQTYLLEERNWSKVPPRAMDAPIFEFLQGGTGFCTVAHRDTYI